MNTQNTYIQHLQNEYDRIYMGKIKKYSTEYFEFSPAVNENLALSVFKYAIERYLKWTPMQAYSMFNYALAKKMKLHPLILHIIFPAELSPTKDLWYIIHKIYPAVIKLDERTLITDMYSRILSGELRKFPNDYFFDIKGSIRAGVCLQYILEHYILYNSIEEMYYSFSCTNKIRLVLSKYKLGNVYTLFFDTPLDYLHYSLPDSQRSDFLYQYYKFKETYDKIKEAK